MSDDEKSLNEPLRALLFLLRRDEPWALEGARVLAEEVNRVVEARAGVHTIAKRAAPAPKAAESRHRPPKAPRTRKNAPADPDNAETLTDIQGEVLSTLAKTGPKKVEGVAQALYGAAYHTRKNGPTANTLKRLEAMSLVEDNDGFWRLTDAGQEAALGV